MHLMPADTIIAEARDAEGRFEWHAGAEAYERALNDASDEGAPPHEIAEMLTGLGRCQRNMGEARAAWRSLMRAIALYREVGLAEAMANASIEALRIWAPPERQRAIAEAALDALGPGESPQHVELLIRLDEPARDEEALAIARRRGYDDVLAQWALWMDGPGLVEHGRVDDYMELVQRAHTAHEAAGDFDRAAGALRGAGYGLLALGDFTRGLRMAEASREYAAARNLRFPTQLAALDIAGVLFARDQLDACEALLDGIPGTLDFRIDLFRAWIAERRGNADMAVGLLPSPDRAGGAMGALSQVHAGRAGVFWRAGRHEGALREVEALADTARGDNRLIADAPAALDAILAKDDHPLFKEILDQADRCPLDHYSTLQGRGIDRVRGWMALRLGDRETAARHFRAGIEWAEREGCTPDAAWCREGLAAASP